MPIRDFPPRLMPAPVAAPILRFQDRQGRGPFKPGMVQFWADADGESPPDVFTDFPQLSEILPRLHAAKMHIGCACLGLDGINGYFTATEQERLRNLGYRLHRAPSNSVVMKSSSQVLFAVAKPLKTLPRFRDQ